MDLSNVPNFNIKVLFVAHFSLISLSLLGEWYTPAYLFYNFILTIALLWSIHKHDSDEPIRATIFINVFSIIMDIIVLAMYFPSGDITPPGARFSAAIAIIHLVFRPFSSLLLVKIMQDRNNVSGDGMGNLFSGPRNRSYEDMDKNAGTSPPNQGGYDFPGAQQI